jgi:hypothetical protein
MLMISPLNATVSNSRSYKTFYKRLGWLLLYLSLVVFPISVAAIDIEQKLKVVFLGRLLNYVTWPATVDLADSESFNICVIGAASFDKLLDSLYSNKQIKQKPVKIRYFTDVEAVSGCHLLFIGISEQAKISQILEAIKNKPIFTVSEVRGFAEKNGMVQFLVQDNKVNMKINYQAYHGQNFEISSELFALSNVDVINR